MTITNKEYIEHKPYYVSMTDKCLSGWGLAKDKLNKLVIGCDSLEEARIVEDNARNRTDMKNINICTKKPYYNSGKYLVSYHDKSDYDSWFEKGYFAK
jgi:hypothetical protein